MKPSCTRAWQVEAIRDGRLRAKDLESSLRHQAACADCMRYERELVALGQEISRLPELGRDPLTVRRTRQQLLAELNETVLLRSEPKPARRAAFLLALAGFALAGSWFVVSGQARPPDATAQLKSVIDVHARPGARWAERQDLQQDRVDLLEGAAEFSVYPHSGRRVVIRMPDGELEDTGTVFEVRVSEQRTTHISVREGRVLVRLVGLPGFALRAGDSWEAPATPAPNAVTAEPSSAPGLSGNSAPRGTAPRPPERLASFEPRGWVRKVALGSRGYSVCDAGQFRNRAQTRRAGRRFSGRRPCESRRRRLSPDRRFAATGAIHGRAGPSEALPAAVSKRVSPRRSAQRRDAPGRREHGRHGRALSVRAEPSRVARRAARSAALCNGGPQQVWKCPTSRGVFNNGRRLILLAHKGKNPDFRRGFRTHPDSRACVSSRTPRLDRPCRRWVR